MAVRTCQRHDRHEEREEVTGLKQGCHQQSRSVIYAYIIFW